MVIFVRFLHVDKKNGIYFSLLVSIITFHFTFILSSKTEQGSAGEQPFRDSLMPFK